MDPGGGRGRTPAAAAMRELFDLDPDLVFLNHGSFGACPRPVREARRAWQDEMERNPVEFLGRRSAALLRQTREQRAAIALPLDDQGFVDAVMAEVTPRTRLVFASHIASTTALVLPLVALVEAAHARGLPVLVDGAHAPGQLELALDALGADFYTGNGHKWLCGPKGSGFLALAAAIEFHREHLGAPVRRACHAQALALMHELAGHFALPVIGSDGHFAQMAALPVPPCDPEALRQRLFAKHRIEVPVTQHEGRCFVRVSVQGYNTREDLETLARALRSAFAHG